MSKTIRYCPKCGEELPTDVEFCPYCGVPIKGAHPAKPSQPADRTKTLDKKIIIVALSLVILIALVLTLPRLSCPSPTQPISCEAHLVSVVELGDNMFERTYTVTCTPRQPTAGEFNFWVSNFIGDLAVQNPQWEILTEELGLSYVEKLITVRYRIHDSAG